VNKNDEKRVREIVRDIITEELPEAIEKALKAFKKEQATALARRPAPPSESGFTDSPPRPKTLPIDDMVDALEEQAFAPVAQEYHKRREVGMSKALAEVMAKLEQGMDLTPMGFGMPAHSYFGRDEREVSPTGMGATNIVVGGVAGFREHFIQLVRDGANDLHAAYEATCQKFGVPSLKKAGLYVGVFAELPDTAGGGFALGRGQAEERVGGNRQLGPFDDEPTEDEDDL